jgi:protein-S-isoprenylcysteine O-methyltransferase Ste14
MTDESTFRAIVLASLALCLPLGIYFRLKAHGTGERLDRREEGLFLLVGLRLCGLLGWVILAAYLVSPTSVRWASLPLPGWLRWVGAALSLVAVPPLLFWTFFSLGRNLTDTVVTRRQHTLVTHGPYRWVRHPFYDVVFLWGLSLFLLASNWLFGVLIVGFAAMQRARSRIEEAKLSERFGDEYRAYQGRTGKFFPKLGPVSTREKSTD